MRIYADMSRYWQVGWMSITLSDGPKRENASESIKQSHELRSEATDWMQKAKRESSDMKIRVNLTLRRKRSWRAKRILAARIYNICNLYAAVWNVINYVIRTTRVRFIFIILQNISLILICTYLLLHLRNKIIILSISWNKIKAAAHLPV